MEQHARPVVTRRPARRSRTSPDISGAREKKRQGREKEREQLRLLKGGERDLLSHQPSEGCHMPTTKPLPTLFVTAALLAAGCASRGPDPKLDVEDATTMTPDQIERIG